MSDRTASDRTFWPIHGAGIAALLGMSAAFYVLVAAPAVRASAAERVQRTELEARVKKDGVLGSSLGRAERDLAEIVRTLDASPLRLKAAEQVNHRLAALIEVAARRGVRVDGVQPGAPLERDRFVKVPIRLAGDGSFRACTLFLHELHESFPDTGVQSIELAGNPASPDSGATFVFNLVWYAAPGGAVSLAK